MEVGGAILDAISNRVPDYVMFIGLVACVIFLARAMNNLTQSLKEQRDSLAKANAEWRGAQTTMSTQFAQLQIELARSTPTRAEVAAMIKASNDNTERLFQQIHSDMEWLRDTLTQRKVT